MDHPIAGVRVQPVEARAIGRNTDLGRDGHRFPINVDGHMGMNVNVEMFIPITRCTIYGRIGSVGRCLTLRKNEIDEADNKQYSRRDDADDRDALSASGTPLLFFTPKLYRRAIFTVSHTMDDSTFDNCIITPYTIVKIVPKS